MITRLESVSTLDELRSEGFRGWAGGSHAILALVSTDIVSSTSLGIEVGDEYLGYEIKTISDAFMVAFRTAGEALDFALTLPSSTGHDRVRIRAGIHGGPLSVRGMMPSARLTHTYLLLAFSTIGVPLKPNRFRN